MEIHIKINLLSVALFVGAMVNETIAQTCASTPIVQLDSTLKETSGLIFFDNRIITHNDSGGEAELYEIDTANGTIARTVSISNASNVDWEDIAQDDNYIYIGDIGNNAGTRTDLKIYKIAKADFLTQNTVVADTISFQYADQLSFTSQPQNTNYDCEAITVFQDSIFLFTKNWINKKTNLYVLPKLAGDYSLSVRDSFDTQGTVTGATYDNYSHSVRLVGYNQANPFMWELSQFSGYDVFSGINTRCGISQTGSMQIEAITVKSESELLISSEEITAYNITLDTYLSKFVTGGVGINEHLKDKLTIYPNPVTHQLNVLLKGASKIVKKIKITNALGQTLYTGEIGENTLQVNTENYPQGVYFVQVNENEKQYTQMFIKN